MLFDHQWNSSLGTVGRTSTERSSFLSAGVYENDVYQFELEETGDLNISLSPSSGDDADLELYRDTNGNYTLDSADELITGSYLGSDLEDTINYESAEADTYFTRVQYFDGGHDDNINYDLALHVEPSPHNSDLFDYTVNYDLGYVGRTATERSTFLEEGIYENDVYQFSLDEAGELDISLHNLSEGDDADLELYLDTNGNGALDSHDELIDSSANAGDADDAIRYDAAAGDYFTRVHYFDGGHDDYLSYDLTLFTSEPTPEDRFEQYQTNYDLGSVGRDEVERSTFLREDAYEHDVYKFSFDETSDINISLESRLVGK